MRGLQRGATIGCGTSRRKADYLSFRTFSVDNIRNSHYLRQTGHFLYEGKTSRNPSHIVSAATVKDRQVPLLLPLYNLDRPFG